MQQLATEVPAMSDPDIQRFVMLMCTECYHAGAIDALGERGLVTPDMLVNPDSVDAVTFN
jgi:hypothetical protein